MRGFMLAVVVLAAGCGRGTPTTGGGVRPPSTFDVADTVITVDYRDNPIEADKRWKGKRGRVTLQVTDFGKDSSGGMYIAQDRFPGTTLGTGGDMMYCRLAAGQDDAVAKLSRGNFVTLEATCTGRMNDGPGPRIVFEDCVIVTR